MENKFAIVVKYHGPTNTKESRISLSSPRFKARKFFSWDHSQPLGSNNQAKAVLARAGVKIDGCLDMDSHYILVAKDWDKAREFFGV